MICLHTTCFLLYISYIERGDPVCGLPSPYISIEKVPSVQGHGNCVYLTFFQNVDLGLKSKELHKLEQTSFKFS